MRLASFERSDGSRSFGTVHGNTVLDAGAELSGRHSDLRSVLAAGDIETLDGLGKAVPLDGLTLLPPIPIPEKILCIGLNYLPHILESFSQSFTAANVVK